MGAAARLAVDKIDVVVVLGARKVSGGVVKDVGAQRETIEDVLRRSGVSDKDAVGAGSVEENFGLARESSSSLQAPRRLVVALI